MIAAYPVGVAEEYLLVAACTGELRGRVEAVLESSWSAPQEPEDPAESLQVSTRSCYSLHGLIDELRRVRLRVARSAAMRNLGLVVAGTHPYDTRTGRNGTGPRIARLERHCGRILPAECLCGMSIQIGVPIETDRARLLGALRDYAPHLLALSASSPLHEGEDLGYASMRALLWRRLPHAGPPPRVESESEYENLVERMLVSGAISDRGAVYWSMRLHPLERAIEVLIPDACPNQVDAASIAALVRLLVLGLAEGALAAPDRSLADSESAWEAALRCNEWQAAHHGLDAVFLCSERESGLDPARDAIRRVIDQVAPLAEALGEEASLRHLDAVVTQGSGADRIREATRMRPDRTALLRWLCEESLRGVGLRHERPCLP